MLKKLSTFVAVLALAMIGFVPAAHASYSVNVYDDGVLQGGIAVIVIGNSLTFSGSTTHFSITNGSGLSNNPGSPSNGSLSLSSNEQITSTFGATGGTHTIEIVLSQTGFTSPNVSPLAVSSSAGGSFADISGSGSLSATYQGFLDNTNALFGQPAGGGTPLQSASASLSSTGTQSLVFNPAVAVSLVNGGTPYSLTDVLTFTFNLQAGSGQDTANASVSTVANVPEPASMALFGSGLFGLAGLIRRRK